MGKNNQFWHQNKLKLTLTTENIPGKMSNFRIKIVFKQAEKMFCAKISNFDSKTTLKQSKNNSKIAKKHKKNLWARITKFSINKSLKQA